MSTLSQPISAAPKASDYASPQEVRWCPGCGDYSILAQTKKILARLGAERATTVFVSGIGCSSRFPYYMNTYGFHGIHGRAPTVATGLKLARPDLDVWIVTGDGDGLSIGGNHFLHVIRRNVDLKILLFNNRIYGLTKGQYSPTSERGKITKSSPMGAPEQPVRPLSVALGAEATFAARALDRDVQHLEYVLERATRHKGTAFVEIYQNCVIFNDGAFEYVSDKDLKAEHTLYLEHGKPMVFGKNKDKGIRLVNMVPQVVSLDPAQPQELLVHDEKADDPSLAFMLSQMSHPRMPEPVGVYRAVERETYGQIVHGQIKTAKAARPNTTLQDLLRGPETWTVS
jgi:2-oxoglutarate ferredoxin oxidoreductase subunit beta